MTVAERLQVARLSANLTQKDLAEKLGMNLRTYGSYERGERDLSTAVLLNICKVLNVSSDYILGRSDSLYGDAVSEKKNPYTKTLSQAEAELLFYFKDLNTHGERIVIEITKTILGMDECNIYNNNKKPSGNASGTPESSDLPIGFSKSYNWINDPFALKSSDGSNNGNKENKA